MTSKATKQEEGKALSASAALFYLAQKGLSLSDPALRNAGLRRGFARRSESGRWAFVQSGLDEYVRLRKQTPRSPNLKSINEVARLIGVSRATIYSWAKQGLLTIHRVGVRRSYVDIKQAEKVRARRQAQ